MRSGERGLKQARFHGIEFLKSGAEETNMYQGVDKNS